jgi:hypothetical protein
MPARPLTSLEPSPLAPRLLSLWVIPSPSFRRDAYLQSSPKRLFHRRPAEVA